MRTLILLMAALVAAVATTPAAAAWDDDDYRETRELTLAADGVDELTIDAGAGSMVLEGESGTDEIDVRATVIVAGVDDDDARRYIEAEKDRLREDLENALDNAADRAKDAIRDRLNRLGW